MATVSKQVGAGKPDMATIKATFALGESFGRYVEIQFRCLVTLAVGFVGLNTPPPGYGDEKTVALAWFEEILIGLKQLQLTDTDAFEEIDAYRYDIEFERFSTEQVMTLKERIDEWTAVITLFLAERGGAPPGSYPAWFGIGFFSGYLAAKMRLSEEDADSIDFDLSLIEPRDSLVQMIAVERAQTGLIDPVWENRISTVRSMNERLVVEEFRAYVEDLIAG